MNIEAGLSPQKITEHADSGIANTFAYAYAHSPFYRKRFKEEGLQPNDVKSVEDLKRVPLTSKQDIAEAGRHLWCVPGKKVVDISTTSGTTGAPTLYPMTQNDIERLGYNEFLSFSCVGLTKKDTVILAVTMDRCFMAGLAYFEGLRKIGATTVRIGTASPIMVLNLMGRFGATAIVSVPSFLKKIAGYAVEKGLDLAKLSVNKLVCIGEPVRAKGFKLTPLGKHISEAWGAKAYSTYGVTEIATSFCECEAECGGHLHPELVWIEILDEKNEPVEEGQVGEIVATTIGVEAMPLLRFKTGDCSFMLRKRCSCGLWTPRIGPIVGRKNQAMKIKGTTVYPAAVRSVLDGIEEIKDYVMIATSQDTLSDKLEIIVAVSGDGPKMERIMREHLQAELKVTPCVRLAGIQEVESLQQREDYRKKQVFIDRRSES